MTASDRRDPGRVLVTGATGFLGAALVRALRAAGVAVRTSDLAAGDRPCDLTRPDQVAALFDGGPVGTVIHCGAVSGPMVMADRPLDVWTINATGTAQLLAAAHAAGAGRVVLCSTSEVYGRLTGPVDEDTPLPPPATAYSASKRAAELAAQAWRRGHGLDAVSLRLSWLYGPGRSTPTLLGRMLSAAAAGRAEAFAENPASPTHYLHLDDAVAGVLAAVHAPRIVEDIVNITAGPAVPMAEVAAILSELAPASRLTLDPAAAVSPAPAAIANGRAAHTLGFRPQVPLSSGLAATLAALRQGTPQ